MATRYAHPTEKHQFHAVRRMESPRLARMIEKKEKVRVVATIFATLKFGFAA
jgi:hypothetical protein